LSVEGVHYTLSRRLEVRKKEESRGGLKLFRGENGGFIHFLL